MRLATLARDQPERIPRGKVATIHEPMVACTIIAPSEYIGAIMELCQARRGQIGGMDYLSRIVWRCVTACPWQRSCSTSSISWKSRTRGYASLDWKFDGEEEADLVKVDILLQGEKVDAFSAITHRDKGVLVRPDDDF